MGSVDVVDGNRVKKRMTEMIQALRRRRISHEGAPVSRPGTRMGYGERDLHSTKGQSGAEQQFLMKRGRRMPKNEERREENDYVQTRIEPLGRKVKGCAVDALRPRVVSVP